MGIAVVDRMLDECREFAQQYLGSIQKENGTEVECTNTLRTMQCKKTLLQSSHKRSQASAEHLRNEVALVSYVLFEGRPERISPRFRAKS